MKVKRKYIPVQFIRIDLNMEDSLAAGSAEVSGGTSFNNFSPDVQEWEIETPGISDRGDL